MPDEPVPQEGVYDDLTAPPSPAKPRDEKGRFLPSSSVSPVQEPGGDQPVPAPSSPHPAYLLSQAAQLGIEDELIQSLPTEALGRVVSREYKRQLEANAEMSRLRTVMDNEVRHVPKTTTAHAAVEDDVDLGVDLSDFDDRLVKVLKTVAGKSQKRIKELEDKLAESEGRQAQREQASGTQILDAAFAKLAAKNPAYEKLFSKEPMAKINGQPHFKHRLLALQEAGIDWRNVNPMTVVRELEEASKRLYDHVLEKSPYDATPVEKPPKVTPEEWARASVAAPTQRNGAAEPKGEALAIKNLEARQRAAGESEELDTLM